MHTGKKESREAELDAGCALQMHLALCSNAALSGALPATSPPHLLPPKETPAKRESARPVDVQVSMSS